MGIGDFFEPRLLRGRQEIADFLGYHLRTVDKLIKEGKIPAYKDPHTGRWMMSNLEYLETLIPNRREEKGDGEDQEAK